MPECDPAGRSENVAAQVLVAGQRVEVLVHVAGIDRERLATAVRRLVGHVVEQPLQHRVQPSGAIFDVERLEWLNGQWIRRLPQDELAERALPFLVRALDAAREEGHRVRFPTADDLAPLLPMVIERLPRLDAIGGSSAGMPRPVRALLARFGSGREIGGARGDRRAAARLTKDDRRRTTDGSCRLTDDE